MGRRYGQAFPYSVWACLLFCWLCAGGPASATGMSKSSSTAIQPWYSSTDHSGRPPTDGDSELTGGSRGITRDCGSSTERVKSCHHLTHDSSLQGSTRPRTDL